MLRSLLAALALAAPLSAEQVVFSEVMFAPAAGKPEFIEVWNITNTPLDMARWSFTAGVSFSFPDFNAGDSQAHFLKPMERILVSAADAAATRAAYPAIPAGVRIFGPWAGQLANEGERVTLSDKNGVIVCTLAYGDGRKWRVAASGAGHSLVLADENQAIDDWRVWRASVNRHGSPGVADPAVPAPGLVLNEVHFSPVTGRVDWVELRNSSPVSTLPATGLSLASQADLSDKVPLSGTVTPGGVISFNVNFLPAQDGEVRIHLVDSSDNVRDAVRLTRATGRDSWQVFPAGSREWYGVAADTRDAQNDPARNVDVVINEIMADPPGGQRDHEFVELYNKGAAVADVGGWRLDDAVDFTIPPGVQIPPGGFLVLAANSAVLNASHAGLAALGDWSGSLANNGERLRLLDAAGNLADEVDYRIGGEWPELAGGNGSSLELVNPEADNAVGLAWQDSDESAKSTFAPVTLPLGTYLDRSTGSGATLLNDDEIHLWLIGDGHVILRNIVLRPTAGGANLFTNGEVTTLNPNNVDGWQARGTHWATYHDAEGVHIVADGHGDNKCNHAEKDAAGMTGGVDYTLTCEARWVWGKPRLVVQSWDMSIGNTALIPVPANLGTPGAQNSRFAAAVPPQISGLRHSPAVPATGQTVTVTARVTSAAPLTAVTLRHRLDNVNANGSWNSTVMTDNGTGGDALAGDGIFSAQVPLAAFGYNSNGAIVEFYVQATAAGGAAAELPRGAVVSGPNPVAQPRPALWVVDNQTPATDLRRVRVVISNYWLDALNTPDPGSQPTPPGTAVPATGGGSAKFNHKFPKLQAHYFPCTFIHNDSEPFYGAGVRKTGSPFTRSTGNSLDRGRLVLPGDRPFRGHRKIYWDNDDANTRMLYNRVHRYYLYLFGVPANENEVLRVTRNNSTYAVRESNEVFDKDMLDRIWPDGSDGMFFELDDRFNIGDDGNYRAASTELGWDYAPANLPGPENPVTYHNNFTPKSREVEYDYGAVIEWNRQLELNGATLTNEQIERMADVRAMAAYAAVRGYSSDWDSITMSRAKNGYFYNRSTDHRWILMHWDSDNAFQANRINDAFIGSEINVPVFYNRPHVRRLLHYYMKQLIGPYALNGPRMSAWLAAEENASASYSIPATLPGWPTTLATSGTSQTRVAVMQTFIGATSLNAVFSLVSPPASTGAATLDINGKAPPEVFHIECVGHPEAVLTWTATGTTDTSPWRLSGIVLAEGANTLTFRAFDEDGVQIGTDLVHLVTKTGNAPPVVKLTLDPASQNVAIGQPLLVDASASHDPDGGPLNFTFTVTPATGFTVSSPASSARRFVFSTPGSYSVTVQAVDSGGASASATRTFTVFAAADFDSFGGDNLSAAWQVEHTELRDAYSPASWYSLNETDGSLVLAITDASTVPLRPVSPQFPLITRAMPAGDWLLQTSLSMQTRQYGNFQAGLLVDTTQGGAQVRYAFAYDGGLFWRLYRAIGAGSFTQLAASSFVPPDATLRIRKTGLTFACEARVNGNWTTIYSTTIPADTVTGRAGIFAATGIVNSPPTSPGQGIRVAFDYLLLSDPGHSSELIHSLRITEMMYNPGPGGVEFVELQNTGGSALDLTGAYFESGRPFSAQFTFGPTVLPPGAFCIVTRDAAAFTAKYGSSALIAGQYSGALDNDGERVTLRDAAGNQILDFTYDDIAPWPLAADGTGPSMEIITTDATRYGDGTNWRASAEPEGSPGYAGIGPDTDGDGFPDSWEALFGTDPNDPASRVLVVAGTSPGGSPQITFPTAAERNYRIDYTDTLTPADWQTLATEPGTGGLVTFTDFTDPRPPRRFYKVTPVP